MPREIELKLRVDSHDPLREHLHRVGAEFLGAGWETNRIYDRVDRSLYAEGKGLRLRTVVYDDNSASPPTVTVKGPRTPDVVKSREEIEVAFDTCENAEEFLRLLGFSPMLVYEKRRESWLCEDCRVELDMLPKLGLFVEIEGPNAEAIGRTRTLLNLDKAQAVAPSYVAMAAEYIQQEGLTAPALVFEHNKG